jgi:hypothetical protein
MIFKVRLGNAEVRYPDRFRALIFISGSLKYHAVGKCQGISKYFVLG